MKKTIFLFVLALGLIVIIVRFIFGNQVNPLSNPSTSQRQVKAEVVPSNTVKSYTDPSGFTFNYPDNLSLTNNEATSSSTYADIQLTAKGVNGSLNLKIADSKFTSLNEWMKKNSFSNPKEVNLGNLKALEITSNEKIVLGALDSGVQFIIEVPYAEKKEFWLSVYKKVLADFSFVQPAKDNTSSEDGSSQDAVTFEGEEVVQ